MRALQLCCLGLCLAATPAAAEWRPASGEVAAAAREPRIAKALAALNRLDRAVVDDDHAAFAALMADDLVVNNPQNTLSANGATTQLNASGRISYSRYDRTIDYAGIRNGLILLMGKEVCVPRSPNPLAGQEVHRRFLDLWREDRGAWRLTGRQATIIPKTRE